MSENNDRYNFSSLTDQELLEMLINDIGSMPIGKGNSLVKEVLIRLFSDKVKKKKECNGNLYIEKTY